MRVKKLPLFGKRALELTHLVTESLYYLINLTPFLLPLSPLYFVAQLFFLFVCFKILHISDNIEYLSSSLKNFAELGLHCSLWVL